MKKNINEYVIILIICTILLICFVNFYLLKKSPADIPTMYVVSFDSDGGTPIPDQKVLKGELAKEPDEPLKTSCVGYVAHKREDATTDHCTFRGWWAYSADIDDYLQFDFSTPITNDLKLMAYYDCSNLCSSGTVIFDGGGSAPAKPLIYLYPEKEMEVEVKLGNINDVITVYPKYNNSWKVKAYPDGTLINKETGRSLYGLYWEGKNYPGKVTNEGFVIKGSDTAKFLEEKLEILGLNEREAEEFIIYWLPQMEHNKYNYIRFATMDEIDNYMSLEIIPKPDTVIRILMEFTPLVEKVNVEEQKLKRVARKGFTAIEWGGIKINQGMIK